MKCQHFDYKHCVPFVVLIYSALTGVNSQAAVPANSQAMPDAKKVLNYLESLPKKSKKRVLLGQHVVIPGAENSRFKRDLQPLIEKFGKWPAIMGGDYSHWESPQPSIVGKQTRLGDFWKSGGLVTISIHMRNPWTNGKEDSWYTSNADIDNLLKQGTTANKWYMKELDRLADGLKELRDRGIVVLWRPFHEAPGTWFWWNKRGSDKYKILWRNMYDYFTINKKLNNLLWVWSPFVMSDSKDLISWYPGSNYVDIVGLDTYEGTLKSSKIKNAYDKVLSLHKPFAFTELGCGKQGCPDYTEYFDAIQKEYDQTTYVLFWTKRHAIHENKNAYGVLHHPIVITLDDVDWKSQSIKDALSLPSVPNNIEVKKR